MESFIRIIEDALELNFSERDKEWIRGETTNWHEDKKRQVEMIVSRKVRKALALSTKDFK